MNIKLKVATLWGDPCGICADRAELDIDGVGVLEIKETLPKEIKDRIADFYIGVYHKRIVDQAIGKNKRKVRP